MCIRDSYPKEPDALVSAERLVETHLRSDHEQKVREARLTFAPLFAPGSDWSKAQASDSVRTAGSDFARASYKEVAREHHRKAREVHTSEDWRAALGLYETVLTTWPDDPEKSALELQAGEAGMELGDYPVALKHYAAAAASGSDSVAAQAMWQRVAVTDAWYESTRRGTDKGRTGTGSDSLARAVLAASDQMIERFPDHPQLSLIHI